MAFMYIDRVGVEIEGGWDNRPENYTGDGSVCCGGNVTGESVSPPYRRFSTLEAYIRENWPGCVDATCGFHIHTSLQTKAMYSRLMEPDFAADTLAFWKTWAERNNIKPSHRFWSRWRGENRYCRVVCDNTLPVMEQSLARGKSGPRYYFLNYSHLAHNTMELRLLPAWKDASVAVQSVTDWCAFIENWLRTHEIYFTEKVELIQETVEPLYISEDVCGDARSGDDYRTWQPGTQVIANGTIDGREFDNVEGEVLHVRANSGLPGGWEVRYSSYFDWTAWSDDILSIRRA